MDQVHLVPEVVAVHVQVTVEPPSKAEVQGPIAGDPGLHGNTSGFTQHEAQAEPAVLRGHLKGGGKGQGRGKCADEEETSCVHRVVVSLFRLLRQLDRISWQATTPCGPGKYAERERSALVTNVWRKGHIFKLQ